MPLIGEHVGQSKSKEEQYIDEMKEFVAKLEKTDGVTEMVSLTFDYDKQMKSQFGEDYDDIDKNGLNFTDEQKAELKALEETIKAIGEKKSASAMGAMGDMFEGLGEVMSAASDISKSARDAADNLSDAINDVVSPSDEEVVTASDEE